MHQNTFSKLISQLLFFFFACLYYRNVLNICWPVSVATCSFPLCVTCFPLRLSLFLLFSLLFFSESTWLYKSSAKQFRGLEVAVTVHFLYELESQEVDDDEEEEEEWAAAAAAAEGHAHPANQNEEPEAVVTASVPLPLVRSLFDYGRWNWVSVLRQIWTEPVSQNVSLSHCVTNGQRGSWRHGLQWQFC